MQTLILIICLLAISVFFYYRSKGENSLSRRLGISDARSISPVISTSPITKISDPVTAAATILISLQSEEFVLGDADEEVIEKLLLNITDQETVNAAIEYAKWAVIEVSDATFVIDRLGNLLRSHLDNREKQQFLEMLDEANLKIGGCYDFSSSRIRLAQQMGLEIAH
jgi:hypothetical protein